MMRPKDRAAHSDAGAASLDAQADSFLSSGRKKVALAEGTNDQAQAKETLSDSGGLPMTASEPNKNDAETIARLAALSAIDYDRARTAAAKELSVRPSTLDKSVMAIRKEASTTNVDFDDIEPWPNPVDPAQLLTDISSTVHRFIVCQSETAHAVALWAAMTWLIDVVQVSPLAVITAPEKRCGKSLLLFLLGKLSYRPLTASNITPAALFRAMDAWKPTLLVDEADAFMRENEELRGILNCGHTRDSAYIVRVVGDDFTPRKFNVWGAKALAGIGHLADTLMDRSVTLELRRKLPGEIVERLRYAEPELFETLAAKLARFADDHRELVRRARPSLPPSLNDRAQDNWEPLLAIADIAGGIWPDLARKAALKLSGVDSATQSVGAELLSDIQEIFDTKRIDKISSAELITALCEDDEKPWATYNRGRQIAPRQVIARLKEHGIKSKNVRIGHGVPKGFERDQFEEAFSRYLTSPENPLQRYTAPQPAPALNSSVAADPLQRPLRAKYEKSATGFDSTPSQPPNVAQHPLRSASQFVHATLQAAPLLDCSGVADKSGEGPTSLVEVDI